MHTILMQLADQTYVPVRHPLLPNSFKIPGCSQYSIDPVTLKVFSFKFDKIRELRTFKKADGYVNIVVTNDAGYRIQITRHRLLASMFIRTIDPTKFDVYDVNHIDGIPGNDKLPNLEWLPHDANVRHAFRNGKCNNMHPCMCRDIDTGEVNKFNAYLECARFVGMSKDNMLYRMEKNNPDHIYPERKQYRKGHSDAPWYIPDDPEAAYLKDNPLNQVCVFVLNTKEEWVADTSRAAALKLGIAESTLSVWLDREGQPVFMLPDMKTYVLIKYGWATEGWRNVADPIKEYYNNNRVHQGIITTDDNGVKKLYPTAKMCADANNLKSSTLCERLRIGPSKRWADGLRYERYDAEACNYIFPLDQEEMSN